MPRPERTAAILVAAGRGLRAGAGGPKQNHEIGGQTVIFRHTAAVRRHPEVFAVQPVAVTERVEDQVALGSRSAMTTFFSGYMASASPFSSSRFSAFQTPIAFDAMVRKSRS